MQMEIISYPKQVTRPAGNGLNPFLPNLATAVLVCWPEAASMQHQKPDSLNPKGVNLSCRAHNVFKFWKQI